MDWEPKMPSWDLGTVVGPSGGGGGGALDLKLGAPTSWRPVPATVSVQQQQQPPAAAPAKRARAGQGQHAAPACSVEGCAADLSRCREYHRRHKVCEAHSKTPVVAVAGQQQRFCQQCSRFHLLGEFDEVKRSCRKRLDGHNRRRRKPQPDPLNPAAGLFANHHGVTRFGSYPQIFSPTSMAEPKWPGGIAVKTEADGWHEQYYSFQGAAAALFHGKPERKHFPFLTDGGDATFGPQQPFTITPSSESSSNSSRHSNGKTTMFAHDGGPDHNCALSLLSDNPAPAHIMVPSEAQHLGGAGGGGVAMQYGGGGGRLRPNNGDVSLTGLSYVSLGGKGAPMPPTSNNRPHTAAATMAVTTSTAAAPAASQLQQYHGYYHHQVSADQGNPDAGGMHALPFSSW